MTAKERILIIRLMEKIELNPAYAETLGVEATSAVKNQNIESDQRGLTVM